MLKYTLLIVLVNKGREPMKLSTRGRYGTLALLDIARHQGDRLVILRDVASRQRISPLYLERLISPLVAGGVVRSTRGARGGVSLAKPAEEIKMSEVIELLEGPINPVGCVNNPGICDRSELCAPRDIWGELKQAINGVLENITIQDLVDKQKRKEQSRELMYHI